MPGLQRREEKYSSTTGVIFLFNLIVGTGALALPGALQKAGWVMGIVLILVLGFFSFVTVTFIVEALAVSNALSRKRYDGSDMRDRDNQTLIEETPLVPRYDNQENNVFEITEKYEIGQMGLLMSSKWCQVIIYFCLCVYLYGDLAIYVVVVAKTCSHILCTYTPDSVPESEITENTLCWKNDTWTRISIYRISAFAFTLLVGPFVFFNLQKTKFLQILTALMRWMAFFIMLVWSIWKLFTEGAKGHPSIAEFKTLPTLFGTTVYSFMCQHSIPGLLQPISNKNRLKAIIGIDFVMVSIFYVSLCMTAIFTFHKLEDLYTLNFWEESSKPNSSLYAIGFSYYLALFPVFTLSTSFPIIGITLRNNLRHMFIKDAPYQWYYDKLLFPMITILPPASLAIAVSDLHLLVGVIGSYAGACVQYMIPCLLLHYARSQAKQFNIGNIYASPFKCKYWIYLVYLWMGVSLVLITTNYVSHLC